MDGDSYSKVSPRRTLATLRRAGLAVIDAGDLTTTTEVRGAVEAALDWAKQLGKGRIETSLT
jgi:hypothetical protein